jgi:hypothetical protein
MAVEVAERFADGLATDRARIEERNKVKNLKCCESVGMQYSASCCKAALDNPVALEDNFFLINPYMDTPEGRESRAKDEAHQLRLLHEIFGQSLRRVSLDSAVINANGEEVFHLANSIYEDRRFEELPLLADALERADCHDSAILDHCRGPNEHVRGCWVLDMVLGKH